MDNYRIDFSDFEISYVYQGFCDNLWEQFYQFAENMRNYCKEMSYKPLNDFVNEILWSFSKEFKEFVEKIIKNWKDSEYSLTQLVNKIGGGKEAEHYAASYMERIENSILSVFNKEIPTIYESVSEPIVQMEKILILNEEIDILLKKIEEMKTQVEQECERREKENQIYGLIKPLFSEIAQGLYDWMKLNTESVIEGADELEKILQDFVLTANEKSSVFQYIETAQWDF